MININFSLSYIELYLISINIIGFLIYGYDKLQALKTTKNISRVSERILLIIALIGATIGAIISMLVFRHKTKKLSFQVKFIVVIAIQGISLYFWSFK